MKTTTRREAGTLQRRAKTPVADSGATGQPPAPPGLRLEKILVPVDFSPASAKALDYAVAFARLSRAEILLVHVVEPILFPAYGQELTADYTALQTNLAGMGRRRLKEFSARAGQGPVRLLVQEGSPWGEIVAVSQKEGIDLIILSTHGHTGLGHVLLGSTAERVMRHAQCPVLIVREREREFISPDAGPRSR